MSTTRLYVASIAGFDASAGAGVLADCKTFERHGVYGFGICSAMTIQNDCEFFDVRWLSADEIIQQLQPLTKKFTIAACKIGIIGSLDILQAVLQFLKQHNPAMHIVWDPVLKASAGFAFHNAVNAQQLQALLQGIELLTPNCDEWLQIKALLNEAELLTQNYDEWVAGEPAPCAVLLKGGHRNDTPGTDILYEPNGKTIIPPGVATVFPKHGSGCVLSAAIAARLALGYSLQDACRLSKQYIENFLNSNDALLGYHYAG